MTLEIRRESGICELHINAPSSNLIDRALCDELTAAVGDAAQDRHLKAFLFTAAGKHFSFGASIPEHMAGEVERFLPAFHRLFETLAATDVPAIAAVRGLCLGGACELAAFCNLLVAEESAEFGVPEITLGVLPPAACVILPWRVGGAVAEDLILSGRRMKAAEAAACGLVSRVCPDGTLEGALQTLLDKQIRPRSAAALRLATRAVRMPLVQALRERLPSLERIYLTELMATRDAHEGIQAFLEKRKPVWADA
ncbi:MAG: enoyl-CoA hydratase/isomerase family protein [Planctomycetota bacterium]